MSIVLVLKGLSDGADGALAQSRAACPPRVLDREHPATRRAYCEERSRIDIHRDAMSLLKSLSSFDACTSRPNDGEARRTRAHASVSSAIHPRETRARHEESSSGGRRHDDLIADIDN
jgi:hypothetical protein